MDLNASRISYKMWKIKKFDSDKQNPKKKAINPLYISTVKSHLFTSTKHSEESIYHYELLNLSDLFTQTRVIPYYDKPKLNIEHKLTVPLL